MSAPYSWIAQWLRLGEPDQAQPLAIITQYDPEVMPVWRLAPGEDPRAMIWQHRLAPQMSQWRRFWGHLAESARHNYVDAHRAPALWRRWLDSIDELKAASVASWGYRAAPGGPSFYRKDAPMDPPTDPNARDRLGELLRGLRLGQLELCDLAATHVDPVQHAWKTAVNPGSMVALLERIDHPRAAQARTELEQVDAGWLAPVTLVQRLAQDVRTVPTLDRLLALRPAGQWRG